MSGRMLLHLPWLLAVLAAGAWVGDAWYSGGRRAPVTLEDGSILPGETSSLPPVNGNAATGGLSVGSGCSAVNCHGGALPAPDANPEDRWKSSATIWGADDRHALAWEVLKGETSRNIISRLAPSGQNPPVPAHENALCLGCHSNPAIAHQESTLQLESERSHGVGCQSCHGQADRWLNPHLAWNDKTDRDAEYAAHGMTRLYDLNVRAEKCAGCHVGAPAGTGSNVNRDVNHDLIAAGHPPLNFEFASYQRRMPRHWRERDRTTGADRMDFETTCWSAGQVATLRASLDQLNSRLQGDVAFPDLSEFNCYDCHHSLSASARRVPTTSRRRGSTGWRRRNELLRLTAREELGAWLPDGLLSFALLQAERNHGSEHAVGLARALELPQKPPRPSVPSVIEIRRKYADVLRSLRHPPKPPAELLTWLNSPGKSVEPLDWYEADWLFHALAAVETERRARDAARRALPNAQADATIDALFDKLAGKLRTGEPVNGVRMFTPRDEDPVEIQSLFDEIIQQLRRLL